MSTITASRQSAPSNVRLAGMGALTVMSAGLAGYLLSIVATGAFEPSMALGIMAAYLLPVISYPLSAAGVLPAFDLWVWYFIGFGWLATYGFVKNVLKQATGTLTRHALNEDLPLTVFTLVWMGITAPLAYGIASAVGYPLQQMIGLWYLFANPFTLPVAVLTDLTAFTHEPSIWVVVVLLWVGWLKGARLASS